MPFWIGSGDNIISGIIRKRRAQAERIGLASLPIEQVIDQFVQQRLDAEKITAAPQADDANLLRRLMLDVAGRIPTSEEAKAFGLVDEVVASRKEVPNLPEKTSLTA